MSIYCQLSDLPDGFVCNLADAASIYEKYAGFLEWLLGLSKRYQDPSSAVAADTRAGYRRCFDSFLASWQRTGTVLEAELQTEVFTDCSDTMRRRHKDMWRAIVGDIVGSVYEWNPSDTKDFEFLGPRCEYTDDTVCTAAVAHITSGPSARRLHHAAVVPAPSGARLRRLLSEMDRKPESGALRKLRKRRRDARLAGGIPEP